MTGFTRKTAPLLAGLLTSALFLASAVSAQQGGDEEINSTVGALELPQSITLLGKADPNVRKATAIVNGDVITATDLDQRLALVILSNGEGKISDEELERLRLQVLRNLIDETLQIQEAKSKKIEVSKEELDQQFARIAANQRSTPVAFRAFLKSKGSSEKSIMRQVQGEMAWQRLLRREVTPFVNVSEDEVKARIDQLNAAKGTDEFRIGEIYMAAAPEKTEEVAQRMQQIMEQIKQGGSFQAFARQYSEATTASVGGDLGWVRLGLLPTELASAAQQMEVGQIAGPISIPGGFDIIYLIDKRKVLSADPRDAVLSLKQIGISFPPGTTREDFVRKANEFGEGVKSLKGCGDAEDTAKRLGAEVVVNDALKARDLPPQLQQILLGLQVGQATTPFGTSEQDGVRVLVLCGRDDPVEANGPSPQEISDQIQEARVGKRARTYLRDLRRDAVIDYN